jgi:hypothetical protein
MADGPVPYFFDSCNVYANTSQLSPTYGVSGSQVTVQQNSTFSRTGNGSIRLGDNLSVIQFPGPIPTRRLTLNLAYYQAGQWPTTTLAAWLRFNSGSTTVLSLTMSSLGVPTLRRGVEGSGTLLATGSVNPTLNAVDYWEIALFVDDTNGYFKVWINGLLSIDFSGNTGNVDLGTINFRNAAASQFAFGYVSDITLCSHDGTPTADQARLGPVTHTTIAPTSDVSVDGVPSSGSDNYAMVDEFPNDGDTTYVELAAPGDKDIYGHSTTLPVDTKPIGVLVRSVQKLPLAGTTQVRHILDDGVTQDEGTDQNVGEGYNATYYVWQENPFTNDVWEKAEVEALNFGVEARPAP